jgi:hypothetical protein
MRGSTLGFERGWGTSSPKAVTIIKIANGMHRIPRTSIIVNSTARDLQIKDDGFIRAIEDYRLSIPK